jgi:3-oxoacyl-[acyl-carrier protein] reductase
LRPDRSREREKFSLTRPAHGPFGENLRSLTALGRYGTVDDIGHMVAFLAGPKAQYITGTALTVDGGANA